MRWEAKYNCFVILIVKYRVNLPELLHVPPRVERRNVVLAVSFKVPVPGNTGQEERVERFHQLEK
jgi:hypothetical protein